MLIISLCYCKHQDEIELKREVTFQIGFQSSAKYTGVYYDKTLKKEIIYFAEPVTRKCLKTFDLFGNIIDSILLVNALDYLGEIEGISVISKDTIIVNSLYTNKYAIINSQGKCWHTVDLNNAMQNINNNIYELYTSVMPSSIKFQDFLIFNCSWRYNSIDRLNNNEPANDLDYLKYFYKNTLHSPYFIKVNDYISQTPNVEFGLFSFYNQISEFPKVFVEPPFFKILNDKIFVFSTYSDFLFVVNPYDLEILEKIKITSRYTDIGIKAPSISMETIPYLEKIINDEARTKGYINRIYYNTIDKEYIVEVVHELKKDDVSKANIVFRPFSIIVFNESFTKYNEFNFPKDKYNGGFSALTQEGLMIAKKPNLKIQSNDHEKTFSIFTFKK